MGVQPVSKPLVASQYLTNRLVNLVRGVNYFFAAKDLNSIAESSALLQYIQRGDSGVHAMQFIIQSTTKDPKYINSRMEFLQKLLEIKLCERTSNESRNNVDATINMKIEEAYSPFDANTLSKGSGVLDMAGANLFAIKERNSTYFSQYGFVEQHMKQWVSEGWSQSTVAIVLLVLGRILLMSDFSEIPFDPAGFTTFEDKGVLKERVILQSEIGSYIMGDELRHGLVVPSAIGVVHSCWKLDLRKEDTSFINYNQTLKSSSLIM